MEDFKLYKDKDLQVEAENPLNFGKVKIGDTKQFTYYLYNSSEYPYEEIELSINRDEVKIVSAPTEMVEKSSAEIILEWKPLVSTKLKVKPYLEIQGFRVENL